MNKTQVFGVSLAGLLLILGGWLVWPFTGPATIPSMTFANCTVRSDSADKNFWVHTLPLLSSTAARVTFKSTDGDAYSADFGVDSPFPVNPIIVDPNDSQTLVPHAITASARAKCTLSPSPCYYDFTFKNTTHTASNTNGGNCKDPGVHITR